MKEKSMDIQNLILNMLRKEFANEFSEISIHDIEEDGHTCVGILFCFGGQFDIESITLERFYSICEVVNKEGIGCVDIIQNIDFPKKEINFGYIISINN